ncbi:MAG: baseplate assembly protein [Candidatus Binataceae bacterium]
MTNPSWQPAANVAQFAVIIDSNGNVQQAENAGVSGLNQPQFAAIAPGSTTRDGGVTWTLVAIVAAAPPAPFGTTPLPPPSFVNDADGLDPNFILADMVSEFQAAAGRTLQPAQVERLLIDLYAYRESLVRNAIEYAGRQNLVAFAAYPMLDYLGALLGVARLGVQPALTTIQFTLANPLTVAYAIPSGTLVGTSDGQFQFATSAPLIISPGQTTGSATAQCTASGGGGNGYTAGQIGVLLNPNAIVASAANTMTSSGGSTPETDDRYRARIQQAPNEFSAAGPGAAYRFFALGASSPVIDALVTSPAPGQVTVYVLPGPLPAQPAAAQQLPRMQYSAAVTVGSDDGGTFISFGGALPLEPLAGDSIVSWIGGPPPPGALGPHSATVLASPAPAANKAYVSQGSAPIVGGDAVLDASPILLQVLAIVNGDTVRPLTDSVEVLPVSEQDYRIAGTVTLYSDAGPAAVTAAVNQAAQEFASNLAARIQRDIVPEEIIAALTVPGVYRVQLTSPAYQRLTAGEWANCTAINLSIVSGTEHS